MVNVGLVFGGNSYEHEVSIVSTITISKLIHEITHFIYLDSENKFYLIDKNDLNSKFFIEKKFKKSNRVELVDGGFNIIKLFNKSRVKLSKMVNLIHGRVGEDGLISSLFEFYNIDAVSPDKEACFVSFDKHNTKLYAKSLGIDVLDYQIITKDDRDSSIKLEYPVIVKPAKLGSSIGISIVKNKKDLTYALDCAFEFDDTIIVEKFISNINEYNLAGTKIDGELIFSIIEEPKKVGYLDFEQKYLDFSRDDKPSEASLDESLKNKLRANFTNIYGNIFDNSIIRCDFFIINNRVYLNEINSVPGSLANYLFKDFKTIFTKLLNGKKVKKSRANINYDYISSINTKGK